MSITPTNVGTTPGISAAANSAVSSAISSAANTAVSGSSNSTNSLASLGPDAFLKLLTTQLANQDPMNPMDDTQSVSQLAQFSALQASQNLENSFTSFSQNFGVLDSAGLIGKSVTVASTTSGGNISGTVSGITFANGVPSFTMNDSTGAAVSGSFTLSQILSIS